MSNEELLSNFSLAVDQPRRGELAASALFLRGWAFRPGARIVEVRATVGTRSAVIPQGAYRPDVAIALSEPHADWCGFEGTLVLAEEPLERAEILVVRATDERGERVEVQVPVRILPSGVDYLEIERARWTGDRVDLEGWMIWAGSEPPRVVAAELGDRRLGATTGNLSRPDVSSRFPGHPAGSCRGFRLAVPLAAAEMPGGESAALRVVATDRRGAQLAATCELAREPAAEGALPTVRALAAAVEQARARGRDEPVVLDARRGEPLAPFFPQLTLVRPPEERAEALPYFDSTIDLVVTDATEGARLDEVRRVAALGTVESGELRWRAEAAELPAPPSTAVVVVVPAGAQHAEASLEAVKATLAATFDGELLVVDDGTEPALRARLRRFAQSWPAARLFRNEASVGLARSCRRAAEATKSELLVFVGSDAVVQPGWLAPLVEKLRNETGVAAVVGKVLRSDGTLHAAGFTLRSDGSTELVGAGDKQPCRPAFEFVREVDAGPTTLLAVRRRELLALGGFDPELPDEEAALGWSLLARESGAGVLYQPASVAVKAESDRASATGSARARRAARTRLAAKWRRLRPDGAKRPSLFAPWGSRDRRRVLVCGPGLPEHDRESGSLRTSHLIELLAESGWDVSYLAVRSNGEERYLRFLQQRGVVVYAGPDSMRAGDEYLDELDGLIRDGGFELALVSFWSLAEQLLPRFRELSSTRVLVDSVDLHYLREERAALAQSQPEPAAKADFRRDRKRRELATYAAADGAFTVSTLEAELLARDLNHAVAISAVPDMEELVRTPAGYEMRSGLLFVGNFRHPPNLEGLVYLCTEILPRLDPALLAAHPLAVVGHGADETVRAAVARVPHARLVGWVPSIVPYLERCLLSLVPLLHGAGTKRKLVQALMVGTPSVSTPIGVEGLGLEHERHVLVADTAEAFARAIARLAADRALWQRLADSGREQILRTHSRAVVAAHLRSAVEATMAAPARALGAAASTAPEPPLYWSLAPDTDAVFRGKFETCVQIFRNWVSPVRSLEGATILDFGCGDGVMALGICLQLGGAHVIGVELTPDFSGLGEAAERILGLDALPSNLELHLLAPGQRIAGRFRPDVVFSWSVFEHVSRESLDEVVLDLHDALAPGGHAFVQVAPLFYSARGSHLFGIVDEPWEHLRTQEDRLRARVLEASLPADSRLTPDEYERHKTQAWSCYETLNRLTADELIELFRRNGFELVSEYRTLCEEQPGAELLSVHGESVLRTEQVVALFRRR